MLGVRENLLVICPFVALLSACAAPGAEKASPPAWSALVEKTIKDETPATGAAPKQPQPANNSTTYAKLTPLSDYGDEWQGSAGAGDIFSGSYTRAIIRSTVFSNAAFNEDGEMVESKSGAAPMLYQPRPWLARALVGKEYSINLTAKISVGALESTIPLVTIGHQSNSDGEQWTRSIHHDSGAFPLFLVHADGSTSAPQVVFTVKASNTYAARGAAAAVSVATQLAKTISSAPTVITRLTADSTRTEARALDAAISKLFGSALSEEHSSDRDLKNWSVSTDSTGPRGVSILFKVPKDESDFNSSAMPVGRWTITFDYPRPSIFSDWRICTESKPRCKSTVATAKKAVIEEISSSEVLSYKLVPKSGELASIRAYLAQFDWYTTAMTAFAGQKDAQLNATASAFCRQLINEITGLGLNSFDAQAVLWAVYKGMPSRFPNFDDAPSCKSALKDFASK